jgi:hypothetical protein
MVPSLATALAIGAAFILGVRLGFALGRKNDRPASRRH